MSYNNSKNSGNRVGRRIRARKVRVIGSDGSNIGILNIEDALAKAEELGLDLVEFGSGEIPTCKILDYGKMKYEQSKKEKKKEKKTHEIQFRPKIAENDLVVKINRAKKFLEAGSNINFVIQFKGRESLHPEIGRTILERTCSELESISIISKKPTLNGKRMFMTLLPKTKQ